MFPASQMPATCSALQAPQGLLCDRFLGLLSSQGQLLQSSSFDSGRTDQHSLLVPALEVSSVKGLPCELGQSPGLAEVVLASACLRLHRHCRSPAAGSNRLFPFLLALHAQASIEGLSCTCGSHTGQTCSANGCSTAHLLPL